MPDNRWNIAARSNRHGRLGLFYQANPLISVEEILIIHAVQRIELVLSAHAAIQRLAAQVNPNITLSVLAAKLG